jgi:hypothetical protein
MDIFIKISDLVFCVISSLIEVLINTLFIRFFRIILFHFGFEKILLKKQKKKQFFPNITMKLEYCGTGVLK